jgi:sortase A
MASNRHSNTSERQPILSAEPSERRFQRLAKRRIKVLRGIERLLLATGLVLVLIYVCNLIYATAMSQAKLWSFSQLKIDSPPAEYEEYPPAPDLSFRAEKRVASYKEALAARMGAPLAVLSIPRLRLDVPVFEGTDGLTLDQGAGRIAGTAKPGESGNIGIAAHRDGFFRSLKDIHMGDRIELAQLQHQFIYTVDNIMVVDPSDTTALKARAQPSLTLVTCYPFYFVGDAPRRYIVQASLANSEQGNSEGDVGTQN